MDNQKVLQFNSFINEAYECFSFADFLKLAILKLHELVVYDSGMFFCAISRDCSFFKPYIGGNIDEYYKKHNFNDRDEYLHWAEKTNAGREAYVYKALDYAKGVVQIENEPRSSFISVQEDFYIACVRIIHKGQFLGEIYLHRSKDKPDFDDNDMFILRLLQPHVSTVFSIIHTISAVKCIETNNQAYIPKGMCMFDKELSLIGGNTSGIEILKIITKMGSSVLYHVKELCRDLMEEGSGHSKDNVVLNSTVLKVTKNDLKVDIFAKNLNRLNNDTRFIVTMEFLNESQTVDTYKFKFSKREAELIDGIIQGKNNMQLAEAFNLSANTIKTHIRNIYQKTGASNRAELAYLLMLNK